MKRRGSIGVLAVLVTVTLSLVLGAAALPAQAAVTRQVTFVLVTSGGVPVTGSYVTWSANDGSASAGTKKRTDAAGRVTFLSVPITQVTLQAEAAKVSIPMNGEVVGGQVSGAGTLNAFVDTAVDIPASGDVVVDVGPAPTHVQQRVVVQMPDGTPVPDAVLSARPTPGTSQDAPWLFRYDPTGIYYPERATWAACPYDPSCYNRSWDIGVGAYSYRMATGSDGAARLWRFTSSQGAPDATCPFVASFNDGELAQNAAFDCVSAGPITVELPYMPAVRIESAPAPVGAGKPVALSLRAVDGTGAPIVGVPVNLEQLTGKSATTSQCQPRLSGVTRSDGRATLVLCPASTGLWQADGPSLVPSRATSVAVQPTSVSGLQVVPGNNRVALTWKAPLDPTAGKVKQYKVTVPGAKGCASAKTSCVVRGLANGRRYTFKIRAVTATGQLPATKVKVVAGSPAAPGKVRASMAKAGLVVSWKAPASTGGAKITGYRVTAGPKACRTTGLTSCVVTGLKQGQSYEVVVAAVNSRGVGVMSAPIIASV